MPGSVDQLAPREHQVLALVARGLANKEIARLLNPPTIEHTVKVHLKHIFLKLAVPNRTAAVAEYLKHTGGT